MEERGTSTTAMEKHTATATTKTTILDIPTDCWNLILSKLRTPRHAHISSQHAHINSLSLTCKHLLSITNTYPCSLTLEPLSDDHLTSVLPPLLRRFSASLQTLSIHFSTSSTVDATLSYPVSSTATAHLRALHLHYLDALPLDGLCHLGSNPNNLKVLTLCHIRGLSDQQLVAVCRVFPSLEEIDVSLNNLSDEGISGLSQVLKYLSKINLSENTLITDKSMIALSDCCLDLTDVKVYGCNALTEYGIGYVMRRSTKLSGFSISALRQATLDKSDSLFSIENSIGFCRNLSKLEFYYMNVEDTWMRSIAKAALPLTQFKMFGRTNSTRASLSGLSTLISAYPKLEKLDLVEKSLTDEMMKGLASYLGNLVVINIGHCSRLTTATFQMLVTNCPALEEMNASSTQLGRGELDEPLVKANNIKSLNLIFNTFLEDELLEKIGLMCPNLEYLDLSFCRCLTSKGIGKLVNCCRELQHLVVRGWLQSVLLFGMDFEGTSLNLEVLNLTEGKFSDECISEIAKACPKLRCVILANCREVTAKGVKDLVENCTNLRVLDLYRCYNVIPKQTKNKKKQKKLDVSPEMLACILSSRPSLRTSSSVPIKYGTY